MNRGVPPEGRRQYAELNTKLPEEAFTADEHQEFLQLIDQIELADAERMRVLIALAQSRNVPVDTLMDQLGIHRSACA